MNICAMGTHPVGNNDDIIQQKILFAQEALDDVTQSLEDGSVVGG